MRQDQDILLLFVLSCIVLAVNGRAARRITGKQLALLKRSVANIRLQTLCFNCFIGGCQYRTVIEGIKLVVLQNHDQSNYADCIVAVISLVMILQ